MSSCVFVALEIWRVAVPNASKASKECRLQSYFGRKIAIDASMSVYQFLIVVGRTGTQMLTDESGEVTSHLQGMFSRTIRLLEAGLKPMYRASSLQKLYVEHGTTLAGLKALGFQFDSCQFHDYIHGKLPYENLKPDHVLRNLLLSLPQQKLVFTNADKAHAARVLSRLGIEDCFEGIICFETLNPSAEHEAVSDKSLVFENGKSIVDANGSSLSGIEKSTGSSIVLCKPSPVAFEVALAIGNINPAKTIFFDESTRNIAAAKASGLTTVIDGEVYRLLLPNETRGKLVMLSYYIWASRVHVGREELVPGADFALNSIHNLREAMPELWECGEGGQLREVLPLAGVETVVLA